jgi:hypothetical protein
VAAVFLLALGLWGKAQVEQNQRRARGAELQTLLEANVSALERWVD